MTAEHKHHRISWPQVTTLLAFLLPLFAWAPLTYPGYFEFYSGFLPIFNLNDLLRHLGDLGWAPVIGQPYDLLRGERALPYLLGMLPRALGMAPVSAVKLVFIASMLAGSLGLYGWARRRLGLWPALLAATVYVYGPIFLATTYVRGAFAEAVFLGLMPWMLWSADAAVSGSRAGAVRMALGLAAAFWTQAGLALWLTVLLLAYVLMAGDAATASRRALKRPAQADASRLKPAGRVAQPSPMLTGAVATARRTLKRPAQPAGVALAGWVGGLALAALGLLPVVLKHGWGGSTFIVFGDHFVEPYQLLLADWSAGGSLSGSADTLTFSLGVVAFALATLSCFVVRGPVDVATTMKPTQHAARTTQRFAAVIALILAFLSTSLAVPIWRFLPFLSRPLTYPWQLLLLVGPWLAWLAGLGGSALAALVPEVERERWNAPLFAGLLSLVLLGTYSMLSPRGLNVPVPDAPMAIFGDDEIALLSAVSAGMPGPGGQVTLLARWQALRPLDQDYTVFFHVLGPDGNRWGQQDTMPQGGKLPTSQWRPGQVVQDQYQILLAPDAPIGGDYRYLLGLYRWQTGQRLTTGEDDKVVLTPYTSPR